MMKKFKCRIFHAEYIEWVEAYKGMWTFVCHKCGKERTIQGRTT